MFFFFLGGGGGILIGTTGSLTCVYLIFLYVYTHRGPGFIVSSEGHFVKSAQNLTEEISGQAQSQAHNFHPLIW